MPGETEKKALVGFEAAYTDAIKKNKDKFMVVVFDSKMLSGLEKLAREGKVEYSGGLDFEKGKQGIGYEKLKGTHWSSPFFFKEDYEMQFHIHVSFKIDKNEASAHPSPEDMANVCLTYPGIIIWECPEGFIHYTLLLSCNDDFSPAKPLNKAYNKTERAVGDNISRRFMKKWRAALNGIGMDYRPIIPGHTKIHILRDTHEESKKRKKKAGADT